MRRLSFVLCVPMLCAGLTVGCSSSSGDQPAADPGVESEAAANVAPGDQAAGDGVDPAVDPGTADPATAGAAVVDSLDPGAASAHGTPGADPAAPVDETQQGPAAVMASIGPDLLSHSAGAVFLRASSWNNSGTHPIYMLDSDVDSIWMANTDEPQEAEAIYELVARADISAVAVGTGERYDWTTNQRVTVQAGPGPEGPWQTLAEWTTVPGSAATFRFEEPVRARYVRVVLPPRPDASANSVLVGEVALAGTLVDPVPTESFAGHWNGGWLIGTFRLVQDGVSLRGCFPSGAQIEGTVDGRIATLRFTHHDGSQATAELIMSHREEMPYVVQLMTDPGAPPAQGSGDYGAVDHVDCRIEGVDGAPPALDPIEAALEESGRALVYDILFDFNRATLRPESGAVLDRIAATMGNHPDWRLTVEGHTDNVGSASYNQTLSEQRARATVAALVARGVSADRLTAVGHGMSRPVEDNATSGGRARNRRVELARDAR